MSDGVAYLPPATWYVMPTTFGSDGALDLRSQRSLTEAALEWGAEGIVVLGVMGEASALSTDERGEVLDAVVGATAGAVPVLAGCSAGAPRSVVDLAEQAAAAGAAAAMVSPPALLRNADALPGFYAEVADRGSLPIVVQDEPAATGVLVAPSILVAAARAARAIAIKLEDPPTPRKLTTVAGLLPGTPIFGGLGGLMAFHELARGAAGTMTGFSYPEILRSLREHLQDGRRQQALGVYARFLPLIVHEAQPVVGLAVRKQLLRLRGVIADATTRIGAPLDALHKVELAEILAAVSIVPDGSRLSW